VNRLIGKVVIITGGAHGMGAAHVALFLQEGAQVALTDIDESRGRELAKHHGKNAIFLEHDVASPADWKRVVTETEKAFGSINVLVNNAGITGDQSSFEEMDFEAYKKVIDINQHGTFLGIRHVTPVLRRANGGSIVNISSGGGMVGMPYRAAYCASKFAVRGLTKTAALELGAYGIRVNSVHPGLIETQMLKTAIAADPALWASVAASIPLRRIAEPNEVSCLIVYLASDESRYCTGSEFIIDGGYTAQ
jgi:3alpha(or 20beta)-hydroxysteroid dehydrogenase